MRMRGWPLVVQRLQRCDAGAALVEFTIVAPLLLLLLAGFSEFGRIVYHDHVLEKSARDAARYLARVDLGDSNSDGIPGPVVGDDWSAAVGLLGYGKKDATGATPLIAYWQPDTTLSPTTSGNTSTLDQGTYEIEITVEETGVDLDSDPTNPDDFTVPVVTVTAAVDFQDIGLLSAMTAFFGAKVDDIRLAGSHEQAHIGE